MNREQRIADLAVHGWEPVKSLNFLVPGNGIWNDQLNVGFRVVRKDWGTFAEVRKVHRPDMVSCEWDEVGDDVLDVIERRLSEK